MGRVSSSAINEGAAEARPRASVSHISERRVSAVLSVYPKEALVVCLCRDCGRETTDNVGNLIREKPVGGLTPTELAEQLRCEGMSCGGPLDVRITRPD